MRPGCNFSAGLFGGAGQILFAHGRLALAVARAAVAAVTRGGGTGLTIRQAGRDYAKTVGSAVYDMGHAIVTVFLMPFVDLARAARLLPRN